MTVFLQCNLHEEDGGVKEEANSKELLKTVCAVHGVLLLLRCSCKMLVTMNISKYTHNTAFIKHAKYFRIALLSMQHLQQVCGWPLWPGGGVDT